MFEFRPFNNADTPALAEVWRSQPPQRGLMQPMSARLLEVCLFAKQYFDPAGFLVATRDGRPVGFAHASFGPDESHRGLSMSTGVTQMVMTHAELDEPTLDDELLHRAEAFLRGRGARRLLGGGFRPFDQFYLGLYGGSRLPGVLDSDVRFSGLLRRNQYTPISEIVVLQRDLASFRPPVSRDARLLKRQVTIDFTEPPPADTWWDANQQSEQDRTRFELRRRADSEEWGAASFWDVEPLGTGWGTSVAGVIDVQIAPEQRRRGLATYLLAEAFRELRTRGKALVEVQAKADDQASLALFSKLGFSPVDTGRVYERQRED